MLQASRLRGLQPGRSTFMTLRAKRRGPRRSHPGWWKAAYPQRRFRRLARAGRRADPGKLEAALAPRRAPVEAAQEACDRALAAAEDSVDLPRNGSAFLILDEQGQRRTARSLIERVVASPPVTGGAVEDRLAVVI
jgi:hypothetical protein